MSCAEGDWMMLTYGDIFIIATSVCLGMSFWNLCNAIAKWIDTKIKEIG